MNLKITFCLSFISLLICSCRTEQTPKEIRKEQSIQISSLTGQLLEPPEMSAASFNKKDSLLQLAQVIYEEDTTNLTSIIWLGRRTAYLWRYAEAIEIYTKGLVLHPQSPELYRHRGHRYLSTRQLDKAITDFEKAANLAAGLPLQIEPDGLPNHLNKPLTNLHSNIYYHLGLAYYLKGNFEKAAAIYEACQKWDIYPDGKVSTADWLYMTYRRMGKIEKADSVLAGIPNNWEMIENHSYYKRLQLYKGLIQPADLIDFSSAALDAQLDLVTQGYGVGNWYLYNGDSSQAFQIFDKILATDYWSAFGYLAAEAEVARYKE